MKKLRCGPAGLQLIPRTASLSGSRLAEDIARRDVQDFSSGTRPIIIYRRGRGASPVAVRSHGPATARWTIIVTTASSGERAWPDRARPAESARSRLDSRSSVGCRRRTGIGRYSPDPRSFALPSASSREGPASVNERNELAELPLGVLPFCLVRHRRVEVFIGASEREPRRRSPALWPTLRR